MDTLQTSKQLSYSLIHGCYEIIQLRNVVVRLMKQCEQISGHMELVVTKLTGRPDGSRHEEDHITTQPELLNNESVLPPSYHTAVSSCVWPTSCMFESVKSNPKCRQ